MNACWINTPHNLEGMKAELSSLFICDFTRSERRFQRFLVHDHLSTARYSAMSSSQSS